MKISNFWQLFFFLFGENFYNSNILLALLKKDKRGAETPYLVLEFGVGPSISYVAFNKRGQVIEGLLVASTYKD